MNYDVVLSDYFEKELKRLFRKYPSLKKDVGELIKSLANNPSQGKSLGQNCYKIRLKISSKNQGKSGGGRVITYVHFSGSLVYLLSIYDKSEKEDISDFELNKLLSQID